MISNYLVTIVKVIIMKKLNELQGGVIVGLQNEPESELFDFQKNVESVNDSEEQISGDLPILEINEFDWKVDLKNNRKKTPSKPPGETRQRKKSASVYVSKKKVIKFSLACS